MQSWGVHIFDFKYTQRRELAKKWIQRIIQTEILKKLYDNFYSLYNILLLIGYTPDIPEDSQSLETSKSEIMHLKDQLRKIISGYMCLNNFAHYDRVQPIYNTTYNAVRRVEIVYMNDNSFEESKILLKNLYNLLHEFVIKLKDTPILNLNMTKLS